MFLYVIENDAWKPFVKFGFTTDPVKRFDSYKTYSPFPFVVKKLWKIKKYPDVLHGMEHDQILYHYLKHVPHGSIKHVYFGAGTEYYKIEDYDCIVDIYNKNHYELEYADLDDLQKLEYQNQGNNAESNNIQLSRFIQSNLLHIQPNEHQQYVLANIKQFYTYHDIGRICWACGLGKALIGIMIVKQLDCKSVVIGVPSLYLQQQMVKEVIKLFPNKDYILLVGSNCVSNVRTTTNVNGVKTFLKQNADNIKVIITTYSSCHLLTYVDFTFDFKIGDEAHHLVSCDMNDGAYVMFHKIKSLKTLFMTATEKVLMNHNDAYSMDNEEQFGRKIDEKSVQWAIENKKITDYRLLVIKNTEEEVDSIIAKLNINVVNKELFLSAYMTLKSIEKYCELTHITLYTNTTENAEQVESYITSILDKDILNVKKEDIYNRALHSNSALDFDEEISRFRKSKYGVISCVYIFGEGFDLPKLNGVCFAQNMVSDIRIVQCALRPNRLDATNPDKVAYIIIPYIDNDDWDNDGHAFGKIRKIVAQLRNVDETIEHKIRVLTSQKTEKITDGEQEQEQEQSIVDVCETICDDHYGELEKLKLRLRYSKTLKSNLSEEQDEYNYVRMINRELGIKSREQYVEMKDVHKNYIMNPDAYFKVKGVWTNWYEFLGFDTSVFLQTKDEWVAFCKDKNVKSVDEYKELCLIYDELPVNPGEFYEHFTSITNELMLYNSYY